MADETSPALRASAPTAALLASAFVVATCGLIYELLASTLASYLLGDSVTQFSTVIGAYLFAMGVGSWVSRYVRGNELRLFVRIELLIALLGGCSADVARPLAGVCKHDALRGNAQAQHHVQLRSTSGSLSNRHQTGISAKLPAYQ